jgi:hypothetical protein
MMSILKLAVTLIACCTLSACYTPQSYVDSQFHRTEYSQIQRLAQPIPVRIDVRFERNGKAYPSADSKLRAIVERTLNATGVFTSSSNHNDAVIHVTANNIADLGAARTKGFGAGLTFGAVGTTVPDFYDFTFTYRDPTGKEHTNNYQHAIYSTIGRASAPVNTEPTSPAAAFAKVTEDVTLNFVKDLQDDKTATSSGGE